MPNPLEINSLANALGEAGLINLGAPAKEHLQVANSALSNVTNPGEIAGWYAVGGDHYVIVCGASPGAEVVNPG